MAWIEIMPAYRDLFASRGWDVSAFLNWNGILVNRHRHREVVAVKLDEHSFYIKREFAATWRDRFASAWHGLGWHTTSVREAKLLQAVGKAGIGCPEVVAFGEDRKQAFVLLRDAGEMTELRAFLPTLTSDVDRQRLALALGRELARLHDAGFDHPDLFAKHILAARDGNSFRFCLLDWQRGRQSQSLSWRMRCRALAVLDATLNELLASDRLRLRCLRSYRDAVSAPDAPPLARLARQIRREAGARKQKRNIREIGQLPVPPMDQQFISLHEGRLLVVRSYYEQFGSRVTAGAMPVCETRHAARQTGRLWELPPLAHILFRLHRFGIAAPRLVAAEWTDSHVSLFTTVPSTIPWQQAIEQLSHHDRTRLVQQAEWIVRQVHDAGYRLPAQESWSERLGVHSLTQEVILTVVEPFENAADHVSLRSLHSDERQGV